MNDERKQELIKRIHAAQHACMTGAGYYLEKDPKVANAKHVRNGLDSAMVQHSAAVQLLIKKGIITEEEYLVEMAEAFETEKARYEKELSKLHNTNITLG